MVRLAKLQRKCMAKAHMDWELFALARRLGEKLPDWADRMLDAPRPAEPPMKRHGN